MQPHHTNRNLSPLIHLRQSCKPRAPYRDFHRSSRISAYSFVQNDYPWRLIPDTTDPAPLDPKHIKNARLTRRKKQAIPRPPTPTTQPAQQQRALPPTNILKGDSTLSLLILKMPGYTLLCLENPLLDIQAPDPTPSLLPKYSLKRNDAILASSEHYGLYADLASLNATHIAGGAAQNTARGACYLLPAKSVLYIGSVGDDDAAETLRSASKAAGLDTEYMVVPGVPTGRCGVIISGRDRSLCTDLAAANEYKMTHLKSPEIWAHAQAASFYYVGSFHLTVCVEAVEALGREAVSQDKCFVLNLSAPFLPMVFKDQLATALAYADVVIGNESEAAAWAESQGVPEADRANVPKIAGLMAKTPKHNSKRARTVVITQGTEPTIVVEQGKEDAVQSIAIRPVEDKEICDTNGAGDAFAGGFMAGLVQGKDVKTCVDMGHWLASLSIRELGPSYPKETLEYKP